MVLTGGPNEMGDGQVLNGRVSPRHLFRVRGSSLTVDCDKDRRSGSFSHYQLHLKVILCGVEIDVLRVTLLSYWVVKMFWECLSYWVVKGYRSCLPTQKPFGQLRKPSSSRNIFNSQTLEMKKLTSSPVGTGSNTDSRKKAAWPIDAVSSIT